jgi:hypothetical protein
VRVPNEEWIRIIRYVLGQIVALCIHDPFHWRVYGLDLIVFTFNGNYTGEVQDTILKDKGDRYIVYHHI